MTTRKRLSGTLTLAGSLPLQQSALRTRVSLRIDGFLIGITTPQVDSADARKLTRPQPIIPARRADVPRVTITSGPQRGWGWSWSPTMCFAYQLHIDVLVREDAQADAVVRSIQPHLDVWVTRLSEWLTVRAPSVIAVGPQGVRETRLFLDDSEEVPMFTMVIPSREPQAASLPEYLDAVRRSVVAGPPLSHVLLVQAEQKRWHDDRRGAVIDAGNAAEIALSSRIARTLRGGGVDPSAVEPVIALANGLAGLYRLSEDLGCVLPVRQGSLLDRLAGPRNRAVHAGEVPSPEGTLRAVNVARQVVEDADPLAPVSNSVHASRRSLTMRK